MVAPKTGLQASAEGCSSCELARAMPQGCSVEELVKWQSGVLESAGYAIIVTDVSGTVTYFNQAAERMLGYSAEEVVGKLQPFVWHDPAEVAARHSNKLHEDGSFSQSKYVIAREHSCDESPDQDEWTYIRKDGRRLPVLLSVTNVRSENGDVTGLLGVAVDITEKKEAELRLREANQRYEALNAELERLVEERTAELQRRNEELQQSLQHLESTERMVGLGELVASVTHDLNTPIANGLLASTALQEDTQKVLQEMEDGLHRSTLDAYLKSANSLSQLIHRNLNRAVKLIESFKHVAVDQTSTFRREFDAAVVISDVIDTLEPSMRRARVTLHPQLEEGVTMDSYPGSLGQVVVNLVNNAVVHAFDDHMEGNVWILMKRSGQSVLIEVFDNGKGISPTIREKIFEPFFTTKGGQGGSGLGLNIVHRLVSTRLGGTIMIAPAEKGACFRMELPLVAPQEATLAE